MSDDDEVGYGKPPKHSQFKKGQSGNPKGRPKGTKNLKTDLEEVLQEKVVILQGDKRKAVSTQRGFLMALANKAVRGDTKAAFLLANLIYRHVDQNETGDDEEPLADDDLAIIEDFLKDNTESRRAPTDQSGGNDDTGDDGGGGDTDDESGETPPEDGQP